MEMTNRKLSFVIPVYRNESSVELVYQKIIKIIEEFLQNYSYEFVFVDDGSDDNSLDILKELAKKDKSVKVISFTRNFGQLSALLAGFKGSTGDATIVLAADLQEPTEKIIDLVKDWEAGSEIVAAFRESRNDSLSSRLTSKIGYYFIRLTCPEIPKGGFDFMLLDRVVLDSFNSIEIRNRFLQGDLLWFGYRSKFIPYTRLRREHGRSQYTFLKRLKNFMDAFLDASYIPIRAISLLGLSISSLGFLYSINILVLNIMGAKGPPGWAPLMIVLLIVGGLIMIMLGVIGEYVWRIYDETRRKPNYIIRETVN
ncbi:hypothetical protein BIY24_01735 [Halobacteriovorax marinus]|uniref:glycosyltransferase family 2 protein n=1 Tax=Halobacteriovorax marinus TaxID=97084 RepID=UPI000BC3109B|nr:glycosyltransferase family 2 protein [Halobacteriovorax marinus]ATH06703.1 hypothetical protein BIY24_01735 [Halobacteriovorax marinus]